jgi:hypothetical protein
LRSGFSFFVITGRRPGNPGLPKFACLSHGLPGLRPAMTNRVVGNQQSQFPPTQIRRPERPRNLIAAG